MFQGWCGVPLSEYGTGHPREATLKKIDVCELVWTSVGVDWRSREGASQYHATPKDNFEEQWPSVLGWEQD